MIKLKISLFIIICNIIFYCPCTLSQNSQSANDTITLPLNNWASQRVVTIALGEMISTFGQQVEYKNISADDQWGALRQGIVHVQLEVWQVSMEKEFIRMLNNGYLVDMGAHAAVGREDWWYPEFVEKFCPELPNWQALNQCAHLFSTPRQLVKEYITPAPGIMVTVIL